MCVYICESEITSDMCPVRVGLMLNVDDDQSAASAMAFFSRVPAVIGSLSQRCIDMHAPLAGSLYCCTCGDSVLYCGWIPIRTPHAWLILSVTRRRVNLNFSICRFTFVELERVESSFRTTRLRCGLLHSLQKKWSVHMHADKTWSMYSIEVHLTRRSQRSEFHSSMIKQKKWTTELEVYLPALASSEK